MPRRYDPAKRRAAYERERARLGGAPSTVRARSKEVYGTTPANLTEPQRQHVALIGSQGRHSTRMPNRDHFTRGAIDPRTGELTSAGEHALVADLQGRRSDQYVQVVARYSDGTVKTVGGGAMQASDLLSLGVDNLVGAAESMYDDVEVFALEIIGLEEYEATG